MTKILFPIFFLASVGFAGVVGNAAAPDFELIFKRVDTNDYSQYKICSRQIEKKIIQSGATSYVPFDGKMNCLENPDDLISSTKIVEAIKTLWWLDTYIATFYRFGKFGLNSLLFNPLYDEAYNKFGNVAAALSTLRPNEETKVTSIKPVIEIMLTAVFGRATPLQLQE